MTPVGQRFQVLVELWQTSHAKAVEQHLDHYRQISLSTAINRASKAENDSSGRRHPHQRRLPKVAPKEIEEKLSTAIDEIEAAKAFGELYQIVDGAIRPVFGVADMMVYDTSLRLSACLEIAVDRVYLQHGALVGAKKYFQLICEHRHLRSGRSVSPDAFPHLSKLHAYQIENFLCVARHSMNPNDPIEMSLSCLGDGTL